MNVDQPDIELRARMAEYDLYPPEDVLWDGRIHRFPGAGKEKGKSGWYRAFVDRKGAVFGDYSSMGEGRITWQSSHQGEIDREVRQEWKERRADQAAREARERKAAIESLRQVWKEAKPAMEHPYFTERGIEEVRDVRVSGERLLIPMRNAQGHIVDLQRIWKDSKGKWKKRYYPGADPKGCRTTIGARRFKKPDDTIYICEGGATGWTIYLATDCAVIVAFSADGLKPVSLSIRRKYPEARIIIAADNDRWTSLFIGMTDRVPNPGLIRATEAAKECKGEIAVPDFRDLSQEPTDFDDLRQLEGLGAVRRWLDPKMADNAVTVADSDPGAKDAEPKSGEERAAQEAPTLPPANSTRQRAPPEREERRLTSDRRTAGAEPAGGTVGPDEESLITDAAEREKTASWFEGLPPSEGGGEVGTAITAAVNSRLAYDFALARDGTIMFYRSGNWYGGEKKGRAPRVAVAEMYACGAGKRLAPIRDAIVVMAGRIEQHAQPIAFDSNLYLVGLPRRKGEPRRVLDLRDGTVRKARRADYVSRSIGAAPDVMKTPVFDAAIETWADGDPDRVRILRLVTASCLVGLQPERAFFFLLGPKGSGKTAYGRLLKMFGGDFIGSLQASDIGAGKLQKRDELIYGYIAGLRGLIAPELPTSALRAGFLKAICGGDEVQARHLYGDPWSYVPDVTFILTTNALPPVNVLDPALLDRARVIQFPRTLANDGGRIPKAEFLPKLERELPGILHKLIPDACELIEGGMKFDIDRFAKDDQQAVKSWALSADKLMGFGELLAHDPQGWIPGEELWARFEKHCREVGMKLEEWKKNTLSRELTKRGWGLVGKRGGVRGRVGIRWKDEGS